MTTPPTDPPPGDGPEQRGDPTDLRPLLFAIAYRMLGSVTDAEDIVQGTYLRYLDYLQQGHRVESPRSMLTTIATRLAIDHLRSARVQREKYMGPWLPEPLITSAVPDTADLAVMSDSLSMAFLLLLETLSPVERAVFLLREVFAYDYGDIAHIVDKTPDNCANYLTGHVGTSQPGGAALTPTPRVALNSPIAFSPRPRMAIWMIWCNGWPTTCPSTATGVVSAADCRNRYSDESAFTGSWPQSWVPTAALACGCSTHRSTDSPECWPSTPMAP